MPPFPVGTCPGANETPVALGQRANRLTSFRLADGAIDMPVRLAAIIALFALPILARAQDHAHSPGMTHSTNAPTQAGQSAFAAIGEIVALLEADPNTDWSKVDLEALRQHLIDMNEVTLAAQVRADPTAGGATFHVTGTRRTLLAIQRMVTAHASMLYRDTRFRAEATRTPDGARLTVTARDPADLATVRRIRGLGFIGLMTLGAHHQQHHLALARGDAAAHAH